MINSKLLISFSFVLILIANITAKADFAKDSVLMLETNTSGPRIGLTYLNPYPNSGMKRDMDENKIGKILSQFGWQFEYQVVPVKGGPSFLVEFIPLITGVEYGILVPNATLAFGIRFPSGFEFGMGPNVILGLDKFINTSLVVAAGYTYKYGGVSIPFNLAISVGPSSFRTSFLFGYAL